jgi:hypothetical membrane protein
MRRVRRPSTTRRPLARRLVTRRPVAPVGLVSSAAAPVLLIGGWTAAASRQAGGFDSLERTISDLAGLGADDRWLMTGALAGLGLCHVTTAAALGDAATAGRLVLAGGGIATVLVAVFPLPADGSGSVPHTAVATVAFLALSVWPALAARRTSVGPLLRPLPAAAATATLLGCLAWFGVQLRADEGVGLAERVTAGLQSLWPLAVTTTVALAARRRR